MWKFIAITSVFFQLSAHAAVIKPNHEVTLNCDPDESSDYFVWIECFLMEIKSSEDQVFVKSTSLDIEHQNFLNKTIQMNVEGNANYPEYFPKNLGKIISGVGRFFYQDTPLKYVSRDDFKDFGPKLKMLGFKGGEIKDIPYDTFYDLHNLNYLDIRDNHINYLAPNLFANSPMFDSLFMSYNQVTELHPDLFKDCPEFHILYAEFNKIEKIDENLFKNNPKMRIISMRHNKIKNVPYDFSKFDLLDVADFTHNEGTCDTMYFNYEPYDEYYDANEKKKWIKNVPDFQKKIEETCRG